MEVGASRRASSGRGRTVPVKVIVPVSSLSFIQTGETHYGGLTFHFAIAGEDGTIWRLESREQTLEFTRNEFPTALRQTVAYSVDVPMQAAKLTLAISVQDRTALVRSALSVPLGTGGRGRGSNTP